MKKAIWIPGILLVCLGACGNQESKCEPGEGAYLTLSTQPDPAVVRPNGVDSINVIAIGQDEECKPISAGTAIVFSIQDQDPDGAGYFPNDEAEITRTFGPLDATTEVKSRTAGSAEVHAFCQDYNLTALPADIEFAN
jgi:hypothetical protein